MKEETQKFLLEFSSHDVNQRRGTIVKLGQTKSKYYLNLLLGIAKYETDINARIDLIKSIVNQEKLNKTINETLLWYSRDTDSQVRKSSIEALNKLNSKFLTLVLLERLEDFDQEIRFFSMDLAGSNKLKECSGKLISILNKADDTATIIRASNALGKIQDPETEAQLFAKFKIGPPDARLHLSNILKLFGDKPKDKFLRILSDSEDPQLLQLSIGALQTIGGEDVIESISKFLHHSDPNVQATAGKALIELDGTTKYIIKEFLEDPENNLIHQILSNKGSIAIEYLIELKNNEKDTVRNNANNILNMLMIQSQNLIFSGSTMQKIDATEVYLKLLDENYAILNINEVKTLIESNLSIEDLKLQKISIKAIRKIGDNSSIEPVESILKISNDDDVIIQALLALGEFKHINSIDTIRNKSHSTKMEIRRMAYHVLGKIWLENPSLIDDNLARMLYDPSPQIKLDSISIAKDLKSPISIPPLKELANARDPEISEKASSALEDMQKHFIENLSLDSSNESLNTAFKSLTDIGMSNENLIESLFILIKEHPDDLIRRNAFYALGNLGNEEILERLDEIDAIKPAVREAKYWSIGRIRQLPIKSEEAIERLRKGDIPNKNIDILKILNEQDHSIFGDYSEDISHQLNEAIKNFEGERWGESINRINNICENITKAIIVDKENELKITNLDALLGKRQRERINILESRANFIERKDIFSTNLLQIHQYRIESDAQHAGGAITTPSNAVQAIHALREVYLIAEKFFSAR